MKKRQSPFCPKCGSNQVVTIEYGYPKDKTLAKAERGVVVLGGCCIDEDSPVRSCSKCGYQWQEQSAPPKERFFK